MYIYNCRKKLEHPGQYLLEDTYRHLRQLNVLLMLRLLPKPFRQQRLLSIPTFQINRQNQFPLPDKFKKFY